MADIIRRIQVEDRVYDLEATDKIPSIDVKTQQDFYDTTLKSTNGGIYEIELYTGRLEKGSKATFNFVDPGYNHYRPFAVTGYYQIEDSLSITPITYLPTANSEPIYLQSYSISGKEGLFYRIVFDNSFGSAGRKYCVKISFAKFE